MFIAQADLLYTIQGKRLFVFNTREFGARVICNIFYGRFNRFQLWQIPSRWEFDLLRYYYAPISYRYMYILYSIGSD